MEKHVSLCDKLTQKRSIQVLSSKTRPSSLKFLVALYAPQSITTPWNDTFSRHQNFQFENVNKVSSLTLTSKIDVFCLRKLRKKVWEVFTVSSPTLTLKCTSTEIFLRGQEFVSSTNKILLLERITYMQTQNWFSPTIFLTFLSSLSTWFWMSRVIGNSVLHFH